MGRGARREVHVGPERFRVRTSAQKHESALFAGSRSAQRFLEQRLQF